MPVLEPTTAQLIQHVNPDTGVAYPRFPDTGVEYDPESGWEIDPATGEVVDPDA